MSAQQLLDDGLDQLRVALDGIDGDEDWLSETEDVCQSIREVENNRSSPYDYLRAYVDLARKTIELRMMPTTTLFRSLPIPPYNLMLPFKAGSIRDCDVFILGYSLPVFNERSEPVDPNGDVSPPQEECDGASLQHSDESAQ